MICLLSILMFEMVWARRRSSRNHITIVRPDKFKNKVQHRSPKTSMFHKHLPPSLSPPRNQYHGRPGDTKDAAEDLEALPPAGRLENSPVYGICGKASNGGDEENNTSPEPNFGQRGDEQEQWGDE